MRGYPIRVGEEVKILSKTGLGEKIMKYMKFLGVASAVLMLVIVTLVRASGRKANSRRCINSWAARTEPIPKQA